MGATRRASRRHRLADHVRDGDVWSLGSVPEVRRVGLESAIAPDFEVTERNGNTLRLSDLRGHKVVLFTWSSW